MATGIAFTVGVVLPAAGCGERMRLAIPKQFCEVNGRPLICYTIDCFHRVPWIQNIIIPTSKEHIEVLQELIAKFKFDKVSVVEGGLTRHRSIQAGIKALQQVSASFEVVVIHDAVRPIVSPDILEGIVIAAQCHGAAGVCRPLVSTVIACNENKELTESLDRSRYFSSEMPQAFQFQIISEAYDKCTSTDFDYGTECLLLAKKYCKVSAKILDGNADLWKVTYKKDLLSAEAVIKEQKLRVAVIHGESWPQFVDVVSGKLNALQIQMVQASSSSLHISDNANTFIILHKDWNIPSYGVNKSVDDMSVFGKDSVEISCDNSTERSCRKNDFAADYSLKHVQNVQNERDFEDVNSITRTLEERNINLLCKLKSVQNQYVQTKNRTELIDNSFIHVFIIATEADGMEQQVSLSRLMLKLAKDNQRRDILVFGILTTMNDPADSVGQMAVSIIHRGHAQFSGQLFLAL